MLEIRLLGQFKVQLNGEAVQIPSRPVQSLLAYLVLSAGTAHRRERIASLLWPDSAEANARSNLRNALWRLRQALAAGGEYLLVDDLTLAFDSAAVYWLDTAILDRRLSGDPSHDELLESVSVYGGELLPGFYYEWTLLERDRLETVYDQKMGLLLGLLVKAGNWSDVLEWGERWIALGHVPEPAYRALMVAHAGLGDLSSMAAVHNRCVEMLRQELDVEPSQQTEELYQQLARGEMPPLPRVLAKEEAPAPGEPPFKGLQYFDESDADLFFGREELTAKLIARLKPELSQRDRRAGGRFLAIVGASGSGKSSILRAGLIPVLRRAKPLADGSFLPEDSEHGPVHVITPTAHPLEALAVSLTRNEESVTAAATLVDDMARDPRSLRLYLQRKLENGESRLLLAVDQFEELFTLCRTEAERQAFVANLLTASCFSTSVADTDGGQGDGLITLVIALRADFYAHCGQYAGLRQALERNQGYVGPMSAEELRRAIEEPARRGGWDFESGLVDLFLQEVGDEPGALPLLSHALLETWHRRRWRTMTLSGFHESGGVRGAIAQTADRVFGQMDPEQMSTTRSVFLRLTELGEGTQDTRRRVEFSELVSHPAGGAQVESVLQTLVDARLVTTAEGTVEVAHEVLIREWPTLRAWLDEDRAALLLHRHLTEAAQAWEKLERDPGELYRGARLAQASEWAEAHAEAPNPLEREFLAASLELAQRREAEREARRQRELEAAQELAAEQEKRADAEQRRAEDQTRAARRLRRRALLLAGAMVIAIILAVVAVLAFQQATRSAASAQAEALSRATQQALAETEAQARATQQAVAELKAREAQEAYSQSLAAHASNALEDRDTATALALALTANDMDQPPELSQRTLRQAAYAPGPHRQYQVAELFPGVDGRIYSLAMSPVEQKALIGFEDGSLILWDVAAESEIHRLAGHSGTVRTAAFSPDGQTALSGSSDRLVILWDLETGQEIRRFEGHDGWVRTVAFGPDGSTAVSGGFVGDGVSSVSDPGELILWDLASGGEVRRFEGHPSGVVAAAFGPDGRAILASSGLWSNVENAYSLMLWDAETGQKIRDFEITGQTDNYSLAVSPDGLTALTGTSGSELILWQLDTGKRILGMGGHVGQMVTSVAYTPDGRRALSGDADGQIILWDLANGKPLMNSKVQEPTVLGWHAEDQPVLNLAIAPDGRIALSSGGDGTLVVWDLVDAGEIRRFEGHQTTAILGAAFTPDGKHVLTGEWGDAFGFSFGDSNRLRLWDVETGEELQSFEGHTAGILMIAVSADGRQALTGSQDGTMRLWDLESGEEIRQILAHTEGVFSVALSPDGRLALSGSMADDLPDSGITLWDLESGQVIHRLEDSYHFTTLVFGPDSQSAYSHGLEGGGLVLYDLKTGLALQRAQGVPCCTGFAIHPNGQTAFLVENTDGIVREWDMEEDREAGQYGQYPGIRTRVEVSPDGRLLLISASNFEGGILSLWDLETGQEIRRFSGDGVCCFDIDMSPDGRMAITPGGGGTAILWDLSLPADLEEVRDWIDDNRYVRELSCEERKTYRIEPLCDS